MIISACGVLCSDCPAYHGAAKGAAHQKRTADAWRRIYNLSELPENISCGGCLGPEDQLFHTSRGCEARHCCLSHGFSTCAACPEPSCEILEHAQSVWDGVPQIGATLSPGEFVEYAQPYCGHRPRLAAIRARLRATR